MNNAVCIVMARGGSKRIPRKNVRLFLGKPMVCWPVEHSIASGLFRETLISTDDAEIAEAAQRAGAIRHALRPEELSDDHATTTDVLRYELAEYERREKRLPDLCCCLYGTSALIAPAMLADALRLLERNKAQLTMAVIRYGHPIERALQFDASGRVQYRQPEFVPMRTQDIAPSYHDAGLFYFFDVGAFLEVGGASFVPLKKTAMEVSAFAVVDIDTEEDWERAEFTAEKRRLGAARCAKT